MVFGLTGDGFVLKDFASILSDAQDRARVAFGPDVDLSPTSALAKVIQVTADEDALLWQRLEDLYFSNFVSTATGADLDRLGEDLGVPRNFLAATGSVQLTLAQPQPGRTYQLPEGTILLTGDSPPIAFHTTAAASLSQAQPKATVPAEAFVAGPSGDVPTGAVNLVDPDYLSQFVGVVAPTTVTVTNPAPFVGGDQREDDVAYRTRMLGFPRSMWTLESVRAAVLSVPGVVDVLLADPLGGVDVAQSYFNLFAFNQRVFLGERRVDEPYFFDIVVAHEFARPWRTQGTVTGLFEAVSAAVDRVRPVGVRPLIVEADHIEVGVRAQIVAEPGLDPQVLRAALSGQLAAVIGGLQLGQDVLFSQVMRVFAEQPGVLDVQDLRLRRDPPVLGRIVFGNVPFQDAVIEVGVGENLTLGPTEIAVFHVDSALLDLEVTGR
jgi:phage-related baseplate assembly protein